MTRKNTADVLLNPVLVGEVLSPSTEEYDRTRESDLYLMIHTASRYSRQPDNSWVLREVSGAESTLFIASLKVTVDLSGIYGEVMDIPG